MSRHIVCPSGLSGEVRHLKGTEADLWRDQKIMRRGMLATRILDACWTETTDMGPYREEEFSWQKALTGDRYYAVIQIRIETYWSELSWDVDCERPSCLRSYEAEIDLEKDLKITHLCEESKKRLASGEPFKFKLPKSEREVSFHLQTGEDELRGMQLSDKRDVREHENSAGIMLRLDEIEGVHPNDKLKFVQDMHLGDQVALLDYMEEVDCGIEGDIPVRCSYCGAPKVELLPLATEAFWYPRRRNRGR